MSYYDKASKPWLMKKINHLGLKLSQHDGKYALGKTGDFHVDHRTWEGSIASVYAFINGVVFAENLLQQAINKNPDVIQEVIAHEKAIADGELESRHKCIVKQLIDSESGK